MPVTAHHWTPWRKALEYAESLATGFVVELGPGARPFRPATEFVGRDITQHEGGYPGTFHALDLSSDRLPWADQSVDFLYTRHTLEDLDNSAWCLSEIRRVAKAGYIETPSPIAELCRGVDAGTHGGPPPWRGYHHHRSILWSGECLNVVAKWPFIEHVRFNDGEEILAELLNRGPLYWNTYHSWTGPLEYRVWRHEVDYDIGPGYGLVLDQAIREGQDSCHRFGEKP
jgi:hypothetical protein